jgi:hypothetical protein
MTEQWKSVSEVKDILGLELDDKKDYQVSNLGHFRIEYLDDEVYEEGHITFSESQASVTIGKKLVLFHRLVALLFVENTDPTNNTVVIYLDGDITNNAASNLAWVSVSERNERRYINQKSTRNVRCIDENKVFASTASAGLYYGIAVDIIRDAIENNHICFGHHFEFCEDSNIESVLYLSSRKAKSLSSMLEETKDLRSYFDEVKLN